MFLRIGFICILAVVGIPFMIPGKLRQIDEAAAIKNAQRTTVTVRDKWTKPVNGQYQQHWIFFERSVAAPPSTVPATMPTFVKRGGHMLVTSDEWASAASGSTLQVALLADGTLHSLNSGADPGFERETLIILSVVWIASLGYLVFLIVMLKRRRTLSGQKVTSV